MLRTYLLTYCAHLHVGYVSRVNLLSISRAWSTALRIIRSITNNNNLISNVNVSIRPSCYFVQILLRCPGVDVNARDNGGSTALMLVARLAIRGMVLELIEAGADLNAVDDTGQ